MLLHKDSFLEVCWFIINENDFPACRVEGESILFIDDDTDCVSDSNPESLERKIQSEAEHSADWLRDNRMVVAGEKSKLVVLGTKELRAKKLADRKLEIVVDGKQVRETRSEKLLGVILNNNMTWREHLYGETWRTEGENSQGLIPQLSQRVGILRKLSRFAPKKKLRMIAGGLFYSKLSYCMPLFMNTWGLDNYRDGGSRSICFSKEDCRKLQVLQNQVSKLLVYGGPVQRQIPFNIPTSELLEKSGDLSVHQLGALQTLTMVKKTVMSQKPSYIAERLQIVQSKMTMSGLTLVQRREGFISRRDSVQFDTSSFEK